MLALDMADTGRVNENLEPGAMVGEFHIERKAAEGGMATVYLAVHPLIAKRAAIKVISSDLCQDPDATKRFIQEARAVNQIGHPNIVDVFSFGRLADGRVYQALEWLEGETLADRMEARDKIPIADAIEIVDQICDALEAAHQAGIVHRDLKPDNVFLIRGRGNREIVKLLDFGIAKLVGKSDEMPKRSTGDVILGTPHYISPEQARGRDVGPATDIYSLGVMMFEMLLGRLPFLADNAADMVRQHLADAPPSPKSLMPDLPPALDRLLLAMMAKEAQQRPSLLEIRATLGGLRMSAQSGFPVLTQTLTGMEAVPAPRSPGRLWAIVAGGVTALLVIIGVAELRPHGKQPAIAAAPPALPNPPPPTRGTLVVHADASDARVAIDGKIAAAQAGEARLDVEAGSHDVDVEAPGRRAWHGSIAVTAGAITSLPVALARQPAANPPGRVRHKPAAASKHATPKRDDYLIDPYGRTR
jgi:tRNA A-37 threonylcarbamoyl transferase component Bud32